MTVYVGGVSQLYQGDLDLGRVAVERLGSERQVLHDVVVEDLHYGAVAVAQRLEELRPSTLVLIGAEQRGRPAGTVERRRITALERAPTSLQEAVSDAVVGYVSIDLVVDVASALGALPARTVAIEVEPARVGPSTRLSAEAQRALDEALELARAEIRRAPLLELADQLRALVDDGRLEPAPALDTMRELLRELEALDADGQWGATFTLRDRVRSRISLGETGEGMAHVDWALWWVLIEELDRLQPLEAVQGLITDQGSSSSTPRF